MTVAYAHLTRFRYYRTNDLHDHTAALRDTIALRDACDLRLERIVHVARADGWTWQEIADALGVGRETARGKYS